MSKTQTVTGCVLMTGPDDRMDHVGDRRQDANELPVQCPHCTFPNLGFVADPYLLARGIVAPTETSPARLGNFLVRERVKQMLELAVPNGCIFFPTADRKNKEPAPWWLAVPNTLLKTAMPKAEPPFCSKCSEPKTWGPLMGPVWEAMKRYDSGGVDVFKSEEWYSRRTVEGDWEETNRNRKASGLPPIPWPKAFWKVDPPAHAERWTRVDIERVLFFSVRLEQLFKRAKVKGQLVRLLTFQDLQPSAEDEVWIQEKLSLLAAHGLIETPKPAAGKSAGAGQKWFKAWLKKNARKGASAGDFGALETQHKLVLPQDYKDFIANVGEKAFADVNDLEGTLTTILLPQKLDFKAYRCGQLPHLEGDDAKVDGVLFAATDFGDAFVFDVAAKGNDYPVYWYRHEENTLEPYAPNFAECVKRFVQKN